MSAIRVSHPGEPTRFVDLGPSPARTFQIGYTIRQAVNVGYMRPILKYGGQPPHAIRVKP